MDLLAWPTAIPTGSLVAVIDLLRGKPVDKPLVARIAWHCAGFGLGKFLPEGQPPIVPIGAIPSMTHEEMALELEAAQAKGAAADGSDLESFISWPTWSAILLEVLKIVFEKLLKKE